MKFHCKEFDCETDDIEDCPECPDYAGCKASGYFTKVTSRQKKQQTFSTPRIDEAGAFPNPERVTEIQEVIKGNWPEKCSMPQCPLDQEDCWNCYKRLEGLKVSFLPCVRDIAHLAALYEAKRNIPKALSQQRHKAAGRKKIARYRMSNDPKAVWKNLRDGLPKSARTYVKKALETDRLDEIISQFKRGHACARVGTRELAWFINNMDALLEKEHVPKDQLMLVAIGALEPRVPISPKAIRKARSRYRHSKK
jgi:hypothetical protein